MFNNPYESPKTATEVQAAHSVARSFGLFEFLLCSLLVVVVGTATYHRLQLADRVAYLNWPLIYFELLGIFSAFFISLIAVVRGLHFFATKRPLKGAVNALISVLALIAAFAAIFIDAPTMIYAS